MFLAGTITQIMETWPLQLTVVDEEGRSYHVALTQKTAVRKLGQGVEARELIPGQEVQAEGERMAERGMRARSIQVVGQGKLPKEPRARPHAPPEDADESTVPESVPMPPPRKED